MRVQKITLLFRAVDVPYTEDEIREAIYSGPGFLDGLLESPFCLGPIEVEEMSEPPVELL